MSLRSSVPLAARARLVSRVMLSSLLALSVAGAASPARAQNAAHHHPLQYLAAPDAVGLVRVDMAFLRDQGMLDVLAPAPPDASAPDAARRAAMRTVAQGASEVLITMLPGGGDEPPVVALARGSFANAGLPPLSGGATEVTYQGFTLRANEGMLGGFIGTQTFVLGDPDGVRAVVDRIIERERGTGVTDAELVQLATDVHLYTAPFAAALRVTPSIQAELPETLTESGAVASMGMELSLAGRNLNVRVAVTYATAAEATAFARGATAALRQVRRSPEVRQMGLAPLLGSIRARARAAVATVTARLRPADVQALVAVAAH